MIVVRDFSINIDIIPFRTLIIFYITQTPAPHLTPLERRPIENGILNLRAAAILSRHPEIFSIARSFYDSPGASVPIVPNG